MAEVVHGPSVAFVTSAWERDWRVVLWPGHFSMVLRSHRHEFAIRLVVLNNFDSPSTQQRAERAARVLVDMGLATDVIHAPTYLTGARLEQFGLDQQRFWQMNPFFSSAHLAALHYLNGKADYMFYFSGDVWLERATCWLPRAIQALNAVPEVRGLNLCRNIYRENFYPSNCHAETDNLWISRPRQLALENGPKGFGLSDHAYLIPVQPEGGWRFSLASQNLEKWMSRWPAYARPCFEMLYRAAMDQHNFGHAALKPVGGVPVTKHKSFPRGQVLKLLFYRWLGFYDPGGKYATRFDGET
jgi:hypothetical protein